VILAGINVDFVNQFDSDCKITGPYVMKNEMMADPVFCRVIRISEGNIP